MPSLATILTAQRGRGKPDWTDWFSYGYLLLGLVLMFGPVLWLLLSSFKSAAALNEFPPQLLPYGQKSVAVAGHDDPLPVYRVTLPDGSTRELAEVRRIGIQATLVDPKAPDQEYKVNIRERKPVREFQLALGNYSEIFAKYSFGTFLWNSVFITVVATLITLLFNAMAAFALSKYKFAGRDVVFLLRQYMLTIPDELIEAARMDHASEWRIFWRIILPLSAPALAVLAIFSVMWRWNDFLWPLIVLSRTEKFTLQLALNAFQGELTTQWHYLLAMTVITLLPVTIVFAFLQRHITTGIAASGVK